MTGRRSVVLLQLPIPPLGPQPIRGNVPLAAAYLKLFARRRGLDTFYEINILPTNLVSHLGDRELVAAILEREPWLVGFTCYLWNIERTLWIAEHLKRCRPDLVVVLGGPEITSDNAWVLQSPAVDYAVIGEGEQTFADLLLALVHEPVPPVPIPGLFARPKETAGPVEAPKFRKPLPRLDAVSSPYLDGILDAADEQMLLLETIRGCVFKCKFCYYPKSYDDLYFLSDDQIIANLKHAHDRGAREVVLLDPTLNQRRDFARFLQLLIRCNPTQQFTYFGELRAEGITPDIATLLREANFTEVEIGLQSTDPHAQELMDRKNNLRAFERGVQAMLDRGIKVKVDLIIGLPGDTVASVRQSMKYLRESGLYTDVQVFNLAVLPGTAFRQEAGQLGLIHQPRPPYYVLRTPTLQREDLFGLMHEAQGVFEMDWDPLPPPVLELPKGRVGGVAVAWRIDLDGDNAGEPPPALSQAFTLWFRAREWSRHDQAIKRCVAAVLDRNPFTTLQVVLEPADDLRSLTAEFLDGLLAACQHHPTYLDRFYALQPGRPIGAKRLIVVAPLAERDRAGAGWIEEVGESATIVWRGGSASAIELEDYEHVAS